MPSSTQSSTTNTTTTTTTTTISPPSTTPSEPSTPTTLAETPSKPFRLLDLPFELVSQILEHSIEGVSSETEPIEIAFSSSSFSCVTTTTAPIIEEGEKEKGEKEGEEGEEGEKTTTTPIIEEKEIEEEEKGEKGEKTTREEEEESESIPLSININLIEMKYPPHNNQEAPHPGIFQTCQLLRSEGPSPLPPPKPPTLTPLPFFLFFSLALHIHLSKSFFTFPCAGPGIRGIRLDEAAAEEKKNLVDEVYLRMREELLAGRNGMLRREQVVSGADADLKKDVVW